MAGGGRRSSRSVSPSFGESGGSKPRRRSLLGPAHGNTNTRRQSLQSRGKMASRSGPRSRGMTKSKSESFLPPCKCTVISPKKGRKKKGKNLFAPPSSPLTVLYCGILCCASQCSTPFTQRRSVYPHTRALKPSPDHTYLWLFCSAWHLSSIPLLSLSFYIFTQKKRGCAFGCLDLYARSYCAHLSQS